MSLHANDQLPLDIENLSDRNNNNNNNSDKEQNQHNSSNNQDHLLANNNNNQDHLLANNNNQDHLLANNNNKNNNEDINNSNSNNNNNTQNLLPNNNQAQGDDEIKNLNKTDSISSELETNNESKIDEKTSSIQEIKPSMPKLSLKCAITTTESTVRSRRLMKEFEEIERNHNHRTNPIFTVELVNDNLYEWHVRLYAIDPESNLAKDMKRFQIPYILLHLDFPKNFPFSPPFMRVVEPHIRKGYVMKGGAICMELLTPRGWASAYTIEALLIQFSASVVKGQGRIDNKESKDFSKEEAEESFRSLVQTHEMYGWVTPALSDG